LFGSTHFLSCDVMVRCCGFQGYEILGGLR
jgi:hypothetical protein